MAGQTIYNLGTGGSVLNGQSGSTSGSDSNDPLWLEWTGTNYVYLPGLASNYLSVPDEAALDITGDIDIRVQLAADGWTPAAAATLLSKWATTGNQRSYLFMVNTSGGLTLYWSTNGTAEIFKNSTAAVTFADGNVGWVRVTLDVDNGAAGNDVKFYTSTNGSTWTQLGATVTTAGTTSIYSSTTQVQLGMWETSGSPLSGKFYRAQVYNGIAGVLALDIACNAPTTGAATSFTAVTGQTVTISRATSGRKTVAATASCWLFGTDDYLEVADNDQLNFTDGTSFSIVAVTRQPSITANQVMVTKKASAALANRGYALRNGATPPATSLLVADGAAQSQSTNASARTAGGVDVTVGIWNGSTDQAVIYNNGTAGSEVTTAVGSAANTEAFRVGRYGGAGTSYVDMELLAVAVFRRALSATEVASIVTYYQSRWP